MPIFQVGLLTPQSPPLVCGKAPPLRRGRGAGYCDGAPVPRVPSTCRSHYTNTSFSWGRTHSSSHKCLHILNYRCKLMHRCIFVHTLPCTQEYPRAELNTLAHQAGAHSEMCENTLNGFPVQALVFLHTEITGCADPFFRPHPPKEKGTFRKGGAGERYSLDILASP